MFFRVKSAGSYQYLQIAHSVRQGEKVRQQVFGTLGRLDELKASGRLEALMRSGLRHCENFAVIDAHAAGETQAVTVERIVPDLVFGRLWEECGIYTTNAIESLHMQLRKVLKNRGHFPGDEAATKLIYLALRNITKKWKNPPVTWKLAATQFAIRFGQRFFAVEI